VKSAATKRTYRQSRRAQASEENTQRILEAGLQLFAERPFDQIALADVAERAGVGLQTLIRRVGTKDGLARAINEWVSPQVGGERDEPASADPAYVAAAVARQYERWGTLIDRMLRQQDASPALAENAEAGRAAHRAWIDTAFAGVLEAQPPAARRSLRARLVAVCGVELWLVLRRDEGLSAAEARDAVAALITACLPTTTPAQEP
jgi:AcrR family transcriptional regulator